jgi:citrate synthase
MAALVSEALIYPSETNVELFILEFYKGVVYLALGLPKDFFTATFAIARILGWTAHLVEQRKDNRIVRPSANYVGPKPQVD